MLQSRTDPARAEQYELPGDIWAAFWARFLSCHSVHALLHPTWPGCKPTCGLWLQVTWESSVPCAIPYHAPSCSANGTVMFRLTWLAPAPPSSLQQSQVRRKPFLERPPRPRAAEVSAPLNSRQHRAEQTFAGKAHVATEPLLCWAHTVAGLASGLTCPESSR